MALKGLRVLEMAGLAPVPFAGMILRDFGARVIRVDRPGPQALSVPNLGRGKESVSVNLKTKEGVDIVKKLADQSDVIIEPFRPGVMEKLGLGPEVLLERNPKLVFARLTGYGQTGPMSKLAGHDINYAAVSGMLSLLGRQGQPPTPPGNLLADFAGGSLTCVNGILMALVQRGITGKGQVIDAAMVDGASYLGTFIHYARYGGLWSGPRGRNLLDSGCPFYDTYETKDKKWLAIGCLEPDFYKQFISRLGVPQETLPAQMDVKRWGELRKIIGTAIGSKTRDEWDAIYGDTDACVTPVLEVGEWAQHPNTVARGGVRTVSVDGKHMVIPAQAPRMAGPHADDNEHEVCNGEHTEAILSELGYSRADVDRLLGEKVVKGA